MKNIEALWYRYLYKRMTKTERREFEEKYGKPKTFQQFIRKRIPPDREEDTA